MKKADFLKRIENDKSRQWIIFWGLELFILIFYFVGGRWAAAQGDKARVSAQGIGIDYNVLAQIEDVHIQEKEVAFSGWALRLESKKTDLDIILKEVNGTEVLVFDTDGIVRKDVEAEFASAWDYGKSGFKVEIPTKKLSKDVCYEIQIGLFYLNDGIEEKLLKFSTNKYLYQGEIFSYNPLTFIEPEIDSKDIMEAVDKGKLLAHSTEKGVWIYEYIGNLYWILDKKYVPILEEAPAIPWLIYTHRADLAPKEEVTFGENEVYVHYSIYLKETDLVKGNETDYYVVSRKIPTEYPVTYMRTGSWSRADSWIYDVRFQIYEFNGK